MNATPAAASAPATTATSAAQRPLPLLAIAVLLMLAGLIALVAMVRTQATASRQAAPAAHSEQVAAAAAATVADNAASASANSTNNLNSADVRQLRVLRFDDAPDGSVAVIDVSNGQLVQRYEGEQGFLRGTLRAMARERRLNGLGAGQPFELILLRDGRLTLHDPATGMRIALESFGATNTGVFARLLR